MAGASGDHPWTALSLFDALIDHLGAEPSEERVELSLLTIDVALAGMHRGRAVVTPRVLDYIRISGTAATPLADEEFASDLLPKFTTLELSEDGLIDPKSKLAGNQLANFSAFLSRRFRANDWMWGRMDAAAGLVDILLRPDHLLPRDRSATAEPLLEIGGVAPGPPSLCGLVEQIVTSPIGVVDNDMAPYATSATVLCRELWRRYGATVEIELEAAASAVEGGLGLNPDLLLMTRRLVTTRWHLEIFVNEAGAVLTQPLEPNDPPVSPPVPASSERGLPQATANIRQLMRGYETSGRLGDIWGSRQTSALGVRVARHAARALAPKSGPLGTVQRTLLAIPLILAADAALLRGAFLVAFSLLVHVVLGPRLNGTVHFVILFISLPAAAVYWSKCVKRSKPAPRSKRLAAWLAGGIALAACVFGVISMFKDWVPFGSPQPVAASSPWAVLFGDDVSIQLVRVHCGGGQRHSRGLPDGLGQVVLGRRFHVVATVLMGWWAAVGAWDQGETTRCGPNSRPCSARCGLPRSFLRQGSPSWSSP